ncbi:hypothetical protein J2T57_002622 [Natronocella acetinitrilica]|uniref:Uncharacterized protein n=1 Tax=Natronocella acetinitrilica TaxID=414046 RepID=A0AAE3KGQ3_9GAMM|nr:hypothetical protein [Natronocella acetinitrilica]MCP1675472.1 hypothetical protein [Natronocella acetinitrilica]
MSRAVSQKAFADMLGVNKSTVTRAKQAGRLVLDGHGRVLVDESLARYHGTAGGRVDVAERHAEARGAALPAATVTGLQGTQPHGQPPAIADDGQSELRRQHKRAQLYYDNQLAKLEGALRRHKRYRVQDVQREALTIGSALRAALERLVDETAPRLCLADSEARAAILAKQVRRVTRAHKAERLRAVRRLRERGGAR